MLMAAATFSSSETIAQAQRYTRRAFALSCPSLSTAANSLTCPDPYGKKRGGTVDSCF